MTLRSSNQHSLKDVLIEIGSYCLKSKHVALLYDAAYNTNLHSALSTGLADFWLKV